MFGKKKTYFILCALIVIIIFSSAAICNLCGTGVQDTSGSSSNETSVKSDNSQTDGSASEGDQVTSVVTTSATTQNTNETTAETTGSDNNEAPTITLAIYEGPTYSAGDDICYYRIQANVNGIPSPSVKFSKDDSGGAWGDKKTQVNIHRGETYTLTATAKNAAGEATATMTLSWGCGEENRDPVINEIDLPAGNILINKEYDITGSASDPDGDSLTYNWQVNGGSINNSSANPMKWATPGAADTYTITLKVTDGNGGEATKTKNVEVVEPVPVNVSLNKVSGEGGWIEDGGTLQIGGTIYAGDSGPAGGTVVGNKMCRGFISYDITGLSGVTITNAVMTLNIKTKWADPSTLGVMWVGVVDHGADALVGSDFNIGGTGVQSFNSASAGNFTCNAEILKTKLQEAINAGKTRFQVRLHFAAGSSDGDSNYDGFEYEQSGLNLNISYIPG